MRELSVAPTVTVDSREDIKLAPSSHIKFALAGDAKSAKSDILIAVNS